jgi:hypothetical protein
MTYIITHSLQISYLEINLFPSSQPPSKTHPFYHLHPHPSSTSLFHKMPESSCVCGLNRISYTSTPLLHFRCHCLDDRKLTGAAFALNILYPSDMLKVLSGKLAEWTKVADSGNSITNRMFPPFLSPLALLPFPLISPPPKIPKPIKQEKTTNSS